MKPLSDDPQIRLALNDSITSGLKGKFHAHLTVCVEESRLDALERLCERARVKLTVIDLENLSGRTQKDVMTTSHYREDRPGAVARIVAHLQELAEQLHEEQFIVIRVKLEHESLPSLPTFDQTRYHEVHIKLRIPEVDYVEGHARLVELGAKHSFVPSRNPLSRKDGYVHQFINRRIYGGTYAEADALVEALTRVVADEGFERMETKRETVVFDTSQKHDQWWI